MGLEFGMKEGKGKQKRGRAWMSEIVCPDLRHVIHSILCAWGSKHTSRGKVLL